MSRSEYSDKLLSILGQKYPYLNAQVIQVMFDTGLIEQKRVIRYVVKHEYFERLKQREANQSMNDIKLDLSIEYDVSVSYINKLIYHCDDIIV